MVIFSVHKVKSAKLYAVNSGVGGNILKVNIMKKYSRLALLLAVSFSFIINGPLSGSDNSLDTSTIEKEIFRLTNEERVKRGLEEYDYDEKLAHVALIHSRNMVEKNFFSHNDRQRRTPDQRIAEYYPEIIGGTGENIAFNHGKTEEAVANSLMTSWMNSPGHRANILSRDYDRIGVGVKQKGNSYYATQKFLSPVVAIPENTPREFEYESEVTLRFEFAGYFDRENLTVYCSFPDRSAKYFISESQYYRGQAPLNPQWIDEKIFEVTFKLDKGRGTYKFLFGKGGRFHQRGFSVTAK